MESLSVVRQDVAAIDVGSEKMHVSIGGEKAEIFGTMTVEVKQLVEWLKSRGVKSVAMEATGVYWMYIYGQLEEAGIEAVTINGRYVKNLPGRKSDMSDPQWLATAHAHGMLRAGFVPPAEIRRLQDYLRIRQDHITMAASHVQHMQKALERMNIKFHDVISSLTGVSGLKVIRAIVKGERDPQRLLDLCDVQIQKKKASPVRESLRGIWRAEHLFALKQALECWDFYQTQIQECDSQIEQVLKEMSGPLDPDSSKDKGAGKPGGINTPQFDGLHRMLVKLCGEKDLTALPGIGDYSLLLILGEVGLDLRKWPTEKHFTAWLGLAPSARSSGKRRRREARHPNRAGRLFCNLARSLAQSVDKGLGGFYRRLRGRRGGLVANKALARKIALLFWRMMVHGKNYVEHGLKKYGERAAQSEMHLLRKLARKHGLTLVQQTNDLQTVHG
jgi:transposase